MPRAVPLLAAACLLAAAGPAEAAPAQPSVAKVHYVLGPSTRTLGTVFFLAINSPVGAVAVGTAHSFDRAELARAGEVELRLGASKDLVALSRRYLTAPGRSFREQGATLRDDLTLFALENRPAGVRVLQPDLRPLPREGERVQLLGAPTQMRQDEDDLFGTIARVAEDRIEVDLDVRADLRGWGGAPLLTEDTGRVIGVLQAVLPGDKLLRVGVTPVGAVMDALRAPLEGGAGAPFARFAPGADPARATPAPAGDAPAEAAAGSPPDRTGGAEPDPTPGARAAVEPADRRSILGTQRTGTAELRLSIEQPIQGDVVGDANGAFVAGRALASVGMVRQFDVLFVIDTSESTAAPSGADIDGDGVVGQAPFGGLGAIFGGASSDPGDSILASEIAAARRLLASLDPRSTRVGIVSFAGDDGSSGVVIGGAPVRVGSARPPSVTEEPLTSDYDRVRRSLDRILARQPEGLTHMAAGVDRATVELLGLRGAHSDPRPDAEKIVLFFTDGTPTLPYYQFIPDNIRAVLRAADRARRAGVRIHAFAIGPEALSGPIAPVEMASRTEGYFTPVRHPADLIDVIEEVSFADVESITVRNLSTGEEADHVTSNPDGVFGALVPLQVGRNRIEVRARSSDGLEASEEITLTYAPGTEAPPLEPSLVALRNRLLERRLLELREGTLEAEQAATAQARKELLVEIERERAAARERAEEQRKELRLEVEDGDAD